MNWVDLILFGFIALSVWSGYQRGFIVCSLELLSWIGSLFIGFTCYNFLDHLFESYVPWFGIWRTPAAFLLTIVIARLLIGFLIDTTLVKTPANAHTTIANKVLGVVPGFVNGVIYATIIGALLLITPLFPTLSNAAHESVVANKLSVQVDWMQDKLSPVFDDALSTTLNRLTIEPKPDETINLSFKYNKGKQRADLEAQMLVLVNEERAKANLKPLKADVELLPVALNHSKDMLQRGYFSHYTPEGKDPFDRMKAADIRYMTAGENLALAQTLHIAHNGLMNSPGHRANILNPAFGRVAIGIVDGGMYGLMISQEFRN